MRSGKPMRRQRLKLTSQASACAHAECAASPGSKKDSAKLQVHKLAVKFLLEISETQSLREAEHLL
jgi:hypothetical protein